MVLGDQRRPGYLEMVLRNSKIILGDSEMVLGAQRLPGYLEAVLVDQRWPEYSEEILEDSQIVLSDQRRPGYLEMILRNSEMVLGPNVRQATRKQSWLVSVGQNTRRWSWETRRWSWVTSVGQNNQRWS